MDGGFGADVFTGGPGDDSASYFDHGAGTTVTLNNVAGDGETGEGDNVKSDVENVSGASGPDTITGSGAGNSLFGGSGNDVLNGGGGGDDVVGANGNDTLLGGTGRDSLFGGPGDDKLNSKDTVPDHDDCGRGTDVVTRNASDFVSPNCEVRR